MSTKYPQFIQSKFLLKISHWRVWEISTTSNLHNFDTFCWHVAEILKIGLRFNQLSLLSQIEKGLEDGLLWKMLQRKRFEEDKCHLLCMSCHQTVPESSDSFHSHFWPQLLESSSFYLAEQSEHFLGRNLRGLLNILTGFFHSKSTKSTVRL